MPEYRIAVDGEAQDFSQADRDTVLRAALRAGVGFPHECNSGGCGSCRFSLLDGEVDNFWPDAPGLSARDHRRHMLLACQCLAKTDLRIKVRTGDEYRPPIGPRRRRARLAATSEITHDIREFRFAAEGAADFLPGQFAMLDIPGVGAPRAYSMSNIANEHGEWHFQIRRLPSGKATGRLFDHLQVGDEIEIDAPFGLAWLRRESPRHLACVAGGSGLAPMISIARGASAAGLLDERQLHFFYGARTPRDVCGERLLQNLPEYGRSLFFHPIVSQIEQTPSMTWTGELGFVHNLVEITLIKRMKEFEFYFAGPPPMTNAMQEMLVIKNHIPLHQIHFDRFF